MTSHDEQLAAAPGPPPVPRGPGVTAGFFSVLALVIAVPVLAGLVSAEVASWILSAGVAVLAIVRLFTPAGGVLRARNRPVDSLVLFAAALGLALLAPMASTVDVTAAL